MLVLPRPLAALLDALAPGGEESTTSWRLSRQEQAQVNWTHASGLGLGIYNGPTSHWTLELRLDQQYMYFAVPCSGLRIRGNDLTSLLRDVAAWIPTLDLVPRRRIAEQLSAWLMLHGITDTCTVMLVRKKREVHILNVDSINVELKRIRVPERFSKVLRAELDAFWSLSPAPDIATTSADIGRTTTSPKADRLFKIDLALTQHARMVSLHALTPDMRALPPPVVASYT